MDMRNISKMLLAANVCDQVLREIGQFPDYGWSLAHVLMNPRAWSLLHHHDQMVEVYIITHGTGDLVCDDDVMRVQAGDAVLIPPGADHMLTNTGMASLEHLVIASPPFDPADVHVRSQERQYVDASARILPQPKPVTCFDGAEIISYAFEGCPSVAFGWVTANSKRRKSLHRHESTTEWIYVVEGGGSIEINGISHTLRKADCVRIDPLERHALRNDNPQHMVVACICWPPFSMSDTHFD